MSVAVGYVLIKRDTGEIVRHRRWRHGAIRFYGSIGPAKAARTHLFADRSRFNPDAQLQAEDACRIAKVVVEESITKVTIHD